MKPNKVVRRSQSSICGLKFLSCTEPNYSKTFLGISIGKRRNNFTAVLPIQYYVSAEELQNILLEFKMK